jgi:hypothetical protein
LPAKGIAFWFFFSTSGYSSGRAKFATWLTRIAIIEKDWVAGFLLRNQLVAKNAVFGFKDRLFQPLTHPSARAAMRLMI